VCSSDLLKLIEGEKFHQRAGKIGDELRSGIAAIGSGAIKEIRGMGLLNGMEIDMPSVEVVKALQAGGLLALTAGPRVVRFLPSFAATSEDVYRAVQIIGGVLAAGGVSP
jgi:acetylornithine/LysW-gamma-L-lysine aminotransferase